VRTGGLLMSAISPEFCEAAYADELPTMRLRAIALALRGARRRFPGGNVAALAKSSNAHSSFSGKRWTITNRGETVMELRGEFAGRSENKQTASTVMPTAMGMILRISPPIEPS
jgi:hypothetical protein